MEVTMVSIGSTIKTLRRAKGITQENLASVLGVTYQSVSKYENETAQPDISLIPLIASYFGVSIDELFGYKLNALTDKEKFVKLMVGNQILNFMDGRWAVLYQYRKFYNKCFDPCPPVNLYRILGINSREGRL